MLAEKWSISCCVSKQGCHRYQRCQPSRASRKEKNTCGIWLVSAAELRKWKTQDTAPQLPHSWDAYEKNDFNEPRLLHLPIRRKCWILNLRFLVFFDSQKHFWWSDNLPFVTNFYINWLFAAPCLLEAVLLRLLELLSPGLEVLIKHNTQILGCDYILSQHSEAQNSPVESVNLRMILWNNKSRICGTVLHQFCCDLQPKTSQWLWF